MNTIPDNNSDFNLFPNRKQLMVSELSDEDRTKLESCIERITEILGSNDISRNEIVKLLLQFDFDIERSVNMLLEKTQAKDRKERKEKDLGYELASLHVDFITHVKIQSYTINHAVQEQKNPLHIPKLNLKPQSSEQSDKEKAKFFIPKLMKNDKNEQQKPKFFIPKLKNGTKPNGFNGLQSHSSNGIKPASNFFIPKLNGDIGNHASDKSNLNSELMDIVNEKEYDSLSELVANHLKLSANQFDKIRSSTKEFDLGRPDITRNGFKKSISVPVGGPPLHSLRQSTSASFIDSLRKQRSFDTVDGAPEVNSWDIDLSVALKATTSAPVVTEHRTNVENSFEIPFIDCESQYTVNISNTLPCTLDASDILKMKIAYSKTASPFGKALCRNYKKKLRKHGSSDNVPLMKIKRFSFTSPSPDDVIRRHLKR